MKKLLAMLFCLTAAFVATSLTANNALADQGFYGNVYAYTYEHGDGSPDLNDNSCYVSNAIVKVYDSSGNFYTQTTASACGYYTISLPAWNRYKIRIESIQYYIRDAYENEQETCGSQVGQATLTDETELKLVYPSTWTRLNAFTW